MADGVLQVRVFVSSPADARFERSRLERVIERLNGEFHGLARLVAIRWENEFYTAAATFQEQIPEAAKCDIVFAVFRARLGTELPQAFPHMSNGEPYPSGTAYEVLSAIEAAKGRGLPDVYVFRYPQPPTVQLDDPSRAEIEAQWQRLKEFFETWFRTPEGQFKAAFQTFSSTDDFEAQAEALLRKWLEEKVLHGRSVVWPVAIKGSPFRGLAAFDAKHAPVFFGRSRDIAKAVDRLKDAAERRCPFMLVDGASGAGKSSLVRAGLVPRLTAAGVVPAIDLWRVAVMRPRELADDPFAALATALFARTEDLPEYQHGRPPALPELASGDFSRPQDVAAQLAHADDTALKPLMAALAAVARSARETGGYDREVGVALLLVVDQFDELFGAGITEEVRAKFAKVLDLLARSGRVWIIATLRGGLIEELLAQPLLKGLKDDGATYDLAPPDAAELAEIVRGPATAAGLAYETDAASGESLDEHLLKDADRPDLLPLLQFTLNQLYEAAKGSAHPNVLTFAAYRALGGLDGAVDKEAESALKSLGEAERGRLPRLLRELAVPAQEGPSAAIGVGFDTRSVPLEVAAYDPTSGKLVQALVDARILLTSGEGKAATVRLAHARVLSSWQRAKTIVAENADFYRIRADVEERRRRWEAAKRSRDLLIDRGRPLAEAESVVRRFPEEIPRATRDFIRRSGRRARLRQTLTAVAAVLFALVAAGAFYARNQAVRAREEAVRAQELAIRRLNESLISQSRSLANAASARLTAADPIRAIAISLEALPVDAAHPDRPYVPEAELSLRAAYRYAQANEFDPVWQVPLSEPIDIARLSPDGGAIATAAGPAIRLFDRATNASETLADPAGQVWAMQFLPNGELVAATPSTLRVYDLASKSYVLNLHAPENKSVCGWDYNTFVPPDQRVRAYFAEGAVVFDHLKFLINFGNRTRQIAAAAAHCIPPNTDAAFVLSMMEQSFSGISTANVLLTDPNPLMAVLDQASKLSVQTHGSARVVEADAQEKFVAAIASADARQFVAATNNAQWIVFDGETLQRMYEAPPSAQPIISLDITGDNQEIMIGHGTGDVAVMARHTYPELTGLGKNAALPEANLSVCSKNEEPRVVRAVDGSRAVRLAEGTARLMRGGEGAALTGTPIGEPDTIVRDAALSPDGRRVVLMGEPRADPAAEILLVYDADTGALVQRKQVAFGEANQCARVSPDGRHAILVNETSARIVDFEFGAVLRDYQFNVNQHFHLLGAGFNPAGDRVFSHGSDGSLTAIDAAAAMIVDQNNFPALAGGDPLPFGVDRTGKQVVIVRPDQPYAWSVFPGVQSLIEAARAYTPICVVPSERATFYLPPEPPEWCIELAKKPYDTKEWKDWLAAKKAGQNPPPPIQ